MAGTDKLNINSLNQWLLQMRGSKLCKDVWLQENEKRELCLKFHQIFLSQPILLELEALLKIVMYTTGNTQVMLQLLEYGSFPPY